jgi:hypothetical protein
MELFCALGIKLHRVELREAKGSILYFIGSQFSILIDEGEITSQQFEQHDSTAPNISFGKVPLARILVMIVLFRRCVFVKLTHTTFGLGEVVLF